MARTPLALRIAFFAIGPAFSIIVPLLTLPAISASYGEVGWASVAVGQSIGVAASIVVELGWSVAGPIQVAREDARGQSIAYRRSLVERGCLSMLILPVLAGLVYLLRPEFVLEAYLTSVAMALGGMSAAWFYVGTSASLKMVILDSLPRVLSSIGGALMLMNGAPLLALPTTQLIASLVLPFVPLVFLPKATAQNAGGVRSQIAATWRTQGAAFVTRVASSAYVALPTALMALVAPVTQVAAFAAVDRIGRTALAGLGPFNLALQGWIPAVEGSERLRRMRMALWLNSVLGLLSFLAFLFLAPWLVQLLFVGEVSIGGPAILAYAVVVCSVVLSRCTGIQCLAVLGKTWTTARSTIAGLFVSVPLVLYLGMSEGAVGAAWAIAVTEVVVLGFQVFALSSFLRSSPPGAGRGRRRQVRPRMKRVSPEYDGQ